MKRMRNTILVLTLILAAAAPVMADEVLTVVADSTLAGHAGFVAVSTSTEDSGGSIFLFEEAGKLRFYAQRGFGTTTWDIMTTAQYVVQTSAMTIGDTWTFIEDDFGNPTVARVGAQEQVTTALGTFDCYRVDIERVSEPGVALETMWFADGVGFVRSQGFLNGWMDWRDDLESYTNASGSGFMPMGVGNTWNFTPVAVANETTNWGNLKSLYR
jgi:hypothetical protein